MEQELQPGSLPGEFIPRDLSPQTHAVAFIPSLTDTRTVVVDSGFCLTHCQGLASAGIDSTVLVFPFFSFLFTCFHSVSVANGTFWQGSHFILFPDISFAL